MRIATLAVLSISLIATQASAQDIDFVPSGDGTLVVLPHQLDQQELMRFETTVKAARAACDKARVAVGIPYADPSARLLMQSCIMSTLAGQPTATAATERHETFKQAIGLCRNYVQRSAFGSTAYVVYDQLIRMTQCLGTEMTHRRK